MCLRKVTKRLKGTGGGNSKPQKWYKIVTKSPMYEGVHFQVYRSAVKNTPIIIGDRYIHKPKKGKDIIFGMAQPNPKYAEAREEYNKLYNAWQKEYRAASIEVKKLIWYKKPKWEHPKDKTGKHIPMYLPRDTYPTGFHFYDLDAARDGLKSMNKPPSFRGTLRPTYQILECDVKRIHTYGEDAHGKACVAYEYEPVKIVN